MPGQEEPLTYEVGEECEKGVVIDIQVQSSSLIVEVVADGGTIKIAGAPFYYSE